MTDHDDNRARQENSENPAMNHEQRVAALRRAKKQAEIADVQRRLDAPRVAADARLVERHGTAAIALAECTFPALTGDYSTNVDLGDQLETAQELPRRLVDVWLATIPNRSTRSLIAALLAEDDFGDDGTRHPRFRYSESLGHIADTAIGRYHREFSSSTGHPEQPITGFALEPPQSRPSTPDTCAYAIMARWPFHREPILTGSDLEKFFADATRHRMCDVQINGGSCDGAIWSESTLIPLIRSEVIVFVAICHNCLKRYRKRRGVSRGEAL